MSAPDRAVWALSLGLALGLAACGDDSSGSGGDKPDSMSFAPTPDADVDANGGPPPRPDAAPATAPPDMEAPLVGPCVADDTCESEAYCAAGDCVAGCRVEPDNCRNTSGGVPQRCDPGTRACAPVEDGPDGCDDDADCAAGRYCGAGDRCVAGCRAGGDDCGPIDRCDPGTHLCVTSTCEGDADCPAGAFCDAASGCAPGCRADAESCPAGQRCDADHRCRAECASDDDCGRGSYCDADLRSCRVECALPDHRGCLADEACDAASRRCVVACRDDAAESGAGNDSSDTASPFNVAADAQRPGVFAGAVVGRILCPGDADFLAVTLPEPLRAEVVLTWNTTPGDLALSVTDAAGQILAQGSGTSPIILRTSDLGAPAISSELRLGVSSNALSGPSAYSLSLRTAPPATGCFPDGSDPLDNRPANGRSAGLRPEARFVEGFAGSLCRGDVDWICLDLEGNDGVIATLTAASPLALALFSAADAAADGDAVPLALATPAEPDEALAQRLQIVPESGELPNGRYCLRVSSPEAEPDLQVEDWALTLDVQRSLVRCGDLAEPNDTLGSALELDGEGALADPFGRLPVGAPLTYPDALRLCPGDVDHFRFDADAGDVLHAYIESDGAAELGDVEVALLDATGRARGDLGTVAPQGPGGPPGPAINPVAALAVAENAGPWYVRVRAAEAGGGEYRLHVQRDAAGLGCDADFQEPAGRNDTPAAASDLAGARANRSTVTNARLCSAIAGQTDEDWYLLDVPAPGHRLCVTAAFRQREGNVDLELYRPDAAGTACVDACDEGACIDGHCIAPVASAQTLHDGEMIATPAAETQAGQHRLRVFSTDSDENAYDLAVTLVPPSDECLPDFQERDRANDTSDRATPLGGGRVHVCDAWLCRDERQTGDWYRITVPAGEDRTVHVGFDGLSEGTVALTLLDPLQPEAGEVFVGEANTVAQCLNLRGGAEAAEALVGLTAIRLNDDVTSRLDYTLQVSPTNLARDARGDCDVLSAGLYREVPWPTVVLGR